MNPLYPQPVLAEDSLGPETLNENNSLFHESTVSPTSSCRGFSGSRNTQREQLIIPWIHCIPNQFSQRILWVQKPKKYCWMNIISLYRVVIIPVPDTSILMQALHISLLSIHPVYWQEQALRCGFSTTSHPSLAWTKSINRGEEPRCFFLFTHLGRFGRSEIILRVCGNWVLSSVFNKRQAMSLPWISLGLRGRVSPGVSNLCSSRIDWLNPGQRQKIRRTGLTVYRPSELGVTAWVWLSSLVMKGSKWDGTPDRVRGRTAWCARLCLEEMILTGYSGQNAAVCGTALWFVMELVVAFVYSVPWMGLPVSRLF
jgi:hypothetical protein